MRLEQVFGFYVIRVESTNNLLWCISVVEIDHPKFHGTEVLSVTKCARGVKVGTSRTLPVNGTEAFELANMYQEALALANTKNLSVDLLLELGYTSTEE